MFNIIGKINQVIFLLAGLLLIFILGKDLVNKLTKEPYERPKVAIVQSQNKEKTIEVKIETTFLRKVKDVYVFSLESDTIDATKSRYSNEVIPDLRMPSRSYSRDQMINIVFLKKGGKKTVLLDRDALIREFTPAKFESNKLGNTFKSNVYHIATEDSNKDGYLSEKDRFSIYVSSYDGTGLKKITDNVTRSYIFEDNTLMIRTGKKYESQYYIYHLLSESLVELDAGTQLTKQSTGLR